MIKLQKRAARSILDKNIGASSEDMFAELHWMKFPDRVDYQKAIIMYKILNNLHHHILRNRLNIFYCIHLSKGSDTSYNNT